MKILSVVLACFLTLSAQAQTLSTTAPNNGSGGVFLNLTPSSQPLDFTGFSTYFASAAGSPVSVEVWIRTGSYSGFTSSSTGWTLWETVAGVSAGSTTESALINFAAPIRLAAGQTMGIYFHSTTAGGGIRYTGTGGSPPTTMYSNADISLFSDTTRTGTVPFGGTQFSPRTFAGTVAYTVVPEPSTFLLLGAGGAVALLRWRQRRQA